MSGTEVRYGGTPIGTIVADGTAGRADRRHLQRGRHRRCRGGGDREPHLPQHRVEPGRESPGGIQVSDGVGGAGKPQLVQQIDVTPQYDGSQPLFAEDLVQHLHPVRPAPARHGAPGRRRYVTMWTSETQDGWGYGLYG